MIVFLSFILPFSLFVIWPSALWNFDGVACAAAVELGKPFYLFHANHLLYGFIGYLFWSSIGLPIGMTRALPALQLLTSLLAAAGLAGLYRLITPIVKSPVAGLLLSVSLGVTASFWVWSIEAQVYSLAFLSLAWATYILIQGNGRFKYVWIGLLHAGAILGHQMHVLWTIPALYWLWNDPDLKAVTRSRALRQYILTAGICTLVLYLLVIGLVIAPGNGWSRVYIWLKGSAALSPDRHFSWHTAGWIGPWIWLKSTLPSLWGSFWPYQGMPVPFWVWGLTGGSIILFTALIVHGMGSKEGRLLRFSWIWIAVYGLFLSTWEPNTLCYRPTDVLPLGILLAVGLSRIKEPSRIVLAGILFGSLAAINLSTRILPMSRPELNPVYQDALSLSKITPSQSLYLTGGGLSWIYLLYFTGRTALNIQSMRPETLVQEIEHQKRSRSVYIQADLLGDPKLAEAVKWLKLKKLEQAPLWLQVQ